MTELVSPHTMILDHLDWDHQPPCEVLWINKHTRQPEPKCTDTVAEFMATFVAQGDVVKRKLSCGRCVKEMLVKGRLLETKPI